MASLNLCSVDMLTETGWDIVCWATCCKRCIEISDHAGLHTTEWDSGLTYLQQRVIQSQDPGLVMHAVRYRNSSIGSPLIYKCLAQSLSPREKNSLSRL